MTESKCSALACLASRSIKSIVLLSCVLFVGIQTVSAHSSSNTKKNDIKVVAQKRMEKNLPGTYHYQSQYEMTKDRKGNYHSTYESQKNEWFCCMDWFSSEETSSTKAEKS